MSTATISAADVNKLRQMTGAGMMDCKKALAEAEGDFEKAIDYLRKKGQKVAANRADREAKEGYILAKTNGNASKGYLIALSCETDFVAKSNDFVKFVEELLDLAITNDVTTADTLKALQMGDVTVNDKLFDIIGKIGEKIEITSYEVIEAPKVVIYIHPGNRVVAMVGLSSATAPADFSAGKTICLIDPTTKAFTIIGMGAQISSSAVAPFTFDGYNLIPRVVEDIIEYDTLAKFNLSSPSNNASVTLLDTITGYVNFNWEKAVELPGLAPATYTWMFDTAGGSFANPIITLNTNVHDTFINVTQKVLAQLLSQKGVSFGQSYYGTWQVKASTSGFTKDAVQAFNVQLVNSINTGLSNMAVIEFDVYPNPANERVTISTKENKFAVNVIDAIGREVLTHQSLNAQTTFSTQELKAGVYWLKVQTNAGFTVKKLVIQ